MAGRRVEDGVEIIPGPGHSPGRLSNGEVFKNLQSARRTNPRVLVGLAIFGTALFLDSMSRFVEGNKRRGKKS